MHLAILLLAAASLSLYAQTQTAEANTAPVETPVDVQTPLQVAEPAACCAIGAARLPGGEAVVVCQADALAWLRSAPAAGLDIAFVDPPFAAGLWDAVLPPLLPALAADAWLYVEAPTQAAIAIPDGFVLHREGHTREVRYALYRRRGAPPPPTAKLGANPAGEAGLAHPNEPASE